MKNLRINKGKIVSRIVVPSSKSYANRALILASLKQSPVTILNVPDADDVIHLISALKSIGLNIDHSENQVIIKNSFPACEVAEVEVSVGEGGTTARFLASMLLLGKKQHRLVLGKRLKDRPWSEFLELAKELDAHAELHDNILTLKGPANQPATLEVDCSRTTQFATGLDLVLRQTDVLPMNLESSQSYWQMNEPLKIHFDSNDEYTVPADWSSAAFPMVFAALHQEVLFPKLKVDPYQADAKLMAILEELKSVSLNHEGITISKTPEEKNVHVEMSDCLDLFPAVTYLLSHVPGRHVLTGLSNLAHKESDRLTEMCKLLDTFERKYEIKNDSLQIIGSSQICDEKALQLPDDHRIVMAAALFLRHHSGGTIDQPESVNKSYPGFFGIFKD